VRQMGTAEMGVAERNQPGHYSANPFEAFFGFAGSGDGPFTDFK
jgi:hypothetical protein